jgi:hypothetical protein
MMRGDLERAGLPYQDEDGLFADFHANRHTFISNLGRAGISLTMAQKLARHSDSKLTANVYTHLGLSDKAQAIACLNPPPDVTKPGKPAGQDGPEAPSESTPAGKDSRAPLARHLRA